MAVHIIANNSQSQSVGLMSLRCVQGPHEPTTSSFTTLTLKARTTKEAPKGEEKREREETVPVKDPASWPPLLEDATYRAPP